MLLIGASWRLLRLSAIYMSILYVLVLDDTLFFVIQTHFQSKVRLDMPTDVFLANLYTEYCKYVSNFPSFSNGLYSSFL